jgi:hypothetical protein
VTAALWRLPTVIDGVARHHAFALAELASLLVAGTALWLELVPSRPLRPRGHGLQVAALAACAMWIIWIIAYILGMATHGVFPAFRHPPGGPLSAVADQELATAVLWAVTGVCFMPVVFLSVLRGLHDDEDVDSEPGRAASATTPPPVRGWGRPGGAGPAQSEPSVLPLPSPVLVLLSCHLQVTLAAGRWGAGTDMWPRQPLPGKCRSAVRTGRAVLAQLPAGKTSGRDQLVELIGCGTR